MNGENKKNKIFSLIIVLAFTIIGVANYYNFFIKDDYEVMKQIVCDPKIDSCFVSDCEGNDSTCDTTPYKKISVTSRYAGLDYDSLECSSGDSHCKIITCQSDTLEDGEKCSK